MGGVSLLGKLAVVLLVFVAILVTVICVVFRERTRGKAIANDDVVAQQASDARVLAVMFTAILCGMLLALLAGWLIFF